MSGPFGVRVGACTLLALNLRKLFQAEVGSTVHLVFLSCWTLLGVCPALLRVCQTLIDDYQTVLEACLELLGRVQNWTGTLNAQ